MELNLKGKVAVITGGSSGIGRAICKGFAFEGAKIVILARNEERGNRVKDECGNLGVESLFVKADVANLEMVEKGVEIILERFGKIDILVNSAAPYVTTGGHVKHFVDQSPSAFREFIDVILYGAINCTSAVFQTMIEKRSGRIVYIGSDVGRIGDGYQAVYAAAKAGVVGFMKSIAQDGGRHNILANVVSPALTLTEEDLPMLINDYGWGTEEGKAKLVKAYPTRKLATAEDIANMVIFLCSSRAGDVAGQVIGVDGGFCMPSP